MRKLGAVQNVIHATVNLGAQVEAGSNGTEQPSFWGKIWNERDVQEASPSSNEAPPPLIVQAWAGNKPDKQVLQQPSTPGGTEQAQIKRPRFSERWIGSSSFPQEKGECQQVFHHKENDSSSVKDPILHRKYTPERVEYQHDFHHRENDNGSDIDAIRHGKYTPGQDDFAKKEVHYLETDNGNEKYENYIDDVHRDGGKPPKERSPVTRRFSSRSNESVNEYGSPCSISPWRNHNDDEASDENTPEDDAAGGDANYADSAEVEKAEAADAESEHTEKSDEAAADTTTEAPVQQAAPLGGADELPTEHHDDAAVPTSMATEQQDDVTVSKTTESSEPAPTITNIATEHLAGNDVAPETEQAGGDHT